MGKALQELWIGLSTAFRAFNALMSAALHLCNWADATAATFEDEATEDRMDKATARRLARNTVEVQAVEMEAQPS